MSTDITAIEQLLAEYCHRLDSGTPAEVAALFHPEAVLQPRFDGGYEVCGRAAIEGWYRHYERALKAKIRHLKHHIGSAWIRVDAARADARCYFLTTYVANAKDQAYFVHGTYTDTLIRASDRWLFLARRIDIAFSAPLAGAMETFPSLGFARAED
jgi:hypothetical protein